jgi:outer membrane autotransporter protein
MKTTASSPAAAFLKLKLAALAALALAAGPLAAQSNPVNNPIVGTGSNGTYYYFDNSLITHVPDRSGTYTYRDTVFSNTTQARAAVRVLGWTAATADAPAVSHPAVFTGTHLTLLANHNAGNGRKALELYYGATAILHSSTIAQTRTDVAAGASELIYLYDNQNQGGSHFYGEDLAISVAASPATAGIRAFAIAYGANTVTLVDSAIRTGAKAAAISWNNNDDALESAVTLQNTVIETTADYAPGIQYVGKQARIAITGGAIATAGANSPVFRLGAGSINGGRSKLQAAITDATLTAAAAYALDLNIDPANTADYWVAASVGNNIGHQGIYEFTLTRSTLSGAAGALRLATTGRDADPTLTEFHLHLDRSTLAGGILMHPGDAATYTTGVKFYLTATDSAITGNLHIAGATAARHAHQAVLELKNTPLDGSVTTDTRADLHLRLTDSPVTGAIALTGSTTAFLTLAGSPVAAAAAAGPGLALADTTRLEASLTRSTINRGLAATGTRRPDGTLLAPAATLALHDSAIDGPLAASTGARLDITLATASAAITGPVTLDDHAVLNLTLAAGARLLGDITLDNRSTLAIHPAAAAGPLTLASTLTIHSGTWRIPAKTTLAAPLVTAGLDAVISIPVADTDILTLAAGLDGAARLHVEKIAGHPLGTPEIRVIHDQTGRFLDAAGPAGPLRLAAPVDLGLASYTLVQRPDGAWLSGGLDIRGAAIANTTALAPQDALAALAPLEDHLADSRACAPPATSGRARSPSAPSATPARFDSGALWLAARASDTTVSPPGDILDYKQHTLGLTVGVDLRYDHPNAASTTLGACAGTSRTTRDFYASADGSTTSAGAGLHAQYRHPRGPFATAAARFDTHKNTLDTHAPDHVLRADYNTQSAALALALGWRLENLLPAGLWLEPSAGAALATIDGATYATTSNTAENRFPVAIGSTRVARLHAALALGLPLNDTIRLRARAAYAAHDIAGGAITVSKIPGAAFTHDDPELQASLALDIRLTQTTRFTLSADYAAADPYTRPWSLALACTRAW